MDDGRGLALVCDWLTGMRGGEKCLDLLCRRWPAARLYTLLHAKGRLAPAIERMAIRTSMLQRVPGIVRHYRAFLPLMPLAARGWRIEPETQAVVSLSHCVAKAVRVPDGVPHLCYCFTPMRYIWHLSADYLERNAAARFGPCRRTAAAAAALLRRWDRGNAERVTHFLAISRTVQARIRECYGRESVVIEPPVDTDYYTPKGCRRGDSYLCVSALTPYKRIDLAIVACNRLGRRLTVIGHGPEEARLRALAGPTVRFLGWQPDAVLRAAYRRCRALLFPGREDFGIVPLEAQACGAPVIALGRDGATETVRPPGSPEPATGLWFEESTPESLCAAIERFELDPGVVSAEAARRNAETYHPSRFLGRMEQCLRAVRAGGSKTFAGPHLGLQAGRWVKEVTSDK